MISHLNFIRKATAYLYAFILICANSEAVGVGIIMNKSELVEAMAKKTHLTKKDCEAALNAFVAAITDAIKSGDRVQLVSFGAFEVKQRAARTARNPKTNEPMEIPAFKLPTFKPGKTLKESIL